MRGRRAREGVLEGMGAGRGEVTHGSTQRMVICMHEEDVPMSRAEASAGSSEEWLPLRPGRPLPWPGPEGLMPGLWIPTVDGAGWSLGYVLVTTAIRRWGRQAGL